MVDAAPNAHASFTDLASLEFVNMYCLPGPLKLLVCFLNRLYNELLLVRSKPHLDNNHILSIGSTGIRRVFHKSSIFFHLFTCFCKY